jgi:hypothetical protein
VTNCTDPAPTFSSSACSVTPFYFVPPASISTVGSARNSSTVGV